MPWSSTAGIERRDSGDREPLKAPAGPCFLHDYAGVGMLTRRGAAHPNSCATRSMPGAPPNKRSWRALQV
jgi:hypothetical protein